MTPTLPERLSLSYEDLLERRLALMSHADLRALLSAVIRSYYQDGKPDEDLPGAEFVATTGQLLARFHPDTLGYIPPDLITDLGEQLIRWLAEGLGRPPTRSDIVALHERLPEMTVRDAIHESCPAAEDSEGWSP